MKTNFNLRKSAFTLIELMVVIAVTALVASMLLPTFVKAHQKTSRISCVNNMKEIGIAYRLWAGDNGDLLPAEQSVALGGWADRLTNADQGALCWTNYAIMANDMGQSPKLLLCPTDVRTNAASSFVHTKGTNNPVPFDDTTLSYFVGVSANDTFPQSIQGGDRNLSPGARPALDYGYSPSDGKGNDVAIPITGPVSWSKKMHSAGNTNGTGNILLGDGSSQQLTTADFNQVWLSNAPPTTNWPVGHVPVSPSIRLVFP
jgi:prepilin-type N-terminal cleavage/methylation domain-containing protein